MTKSNLFLVLSPLNNRDELTVTTWEKVEQEMCARERKTKKRQFYLPRETEPVISREKKTFLFTTFVTSEQQFSNDASSIDANVFSPLSILFSHGMVYQPSFTPFRIPACQVKYK